MATLHRHWPHHETGTHAARKLPAQQGRGSTACPMGRSLPGHQHRLFVPRFQLHQRAFRSHTGMFCLSRKGGGCLGRRDVATTGSRSADRRRSAAVPGRRQRCCPASATRQASGASHVCPPRMSTLVTQTSGCQSAAHGECTHGAPGEGRTGAALSLRGPGRVCRRSAAGAGLACPRSLARAWTQKRG